MGQLYSHLPSVHLNSYEEIKDEPTTTTPATPGMMDQTLQTPLGDTAGKMSKNLTALIDPRSPTVGVSRTPVEVVAERERTRQERARKLRSLDALTVPNNDSGKISGKGDGGVTITVTTPTEFIDPRSPTFEYNRTPLALGSANHGGDKEFSSEVQEDISAKKVYDYEMSVPSNSGQLCRDLRKRLFVAQFNEPLVDTQEDNKEN